MFYNKAVAKGELWGLYPLQPKVKFEEFVCKRGISNNQVLRKSAFSFLLSMLLKGNQIFTGALQLDAAYFNKNKVWKICIIRFATGIHDYMIL